MRRPRSRPAGRSRCCFRGKPQSSSAWAAIGLGSLAAIRHLRPHFPRQSSYACAECRVGDRSERDLGILNFERHKWGGVRHGDPIYAWFDLDLFCRSENLAESPEDLVILNSVLDAARGSDAGDRPSDLERPRLVPSNKAERVVLLGILGVCGLFSPPDHPGLLGQWVPAYEREPPPKPSKNDWLYPIFWWRGELRVNEAAARAVFGDRLR